jgi:ribosomal protein S18 acetylase RimI-like enzyme
MNKQVVSHFSEAHRKAAIALMALLQDTERAISSDRRHGLSMAPEHINYLLGRVQAQDGAFLTAVKNDDVIGFLVIIISAEDLGDKHLEAHYRRYGEITDLVVDPDHRGQGIAQALLEHAIEHVRDRNLSRIKVTALEGNDAASSLYLSTGFRPAERTFILDI